MAGEIQLNSVSLASESGGVITLNNGTLSNSVVFPSGHVIQRSALATYTTQTSTTATSAATGLNILTASISSLKKVNTTIGLTFFLNVFHVNHGTGHIAFSRSINGGTVTYQFQNASSTGKTNSAINVRLNASGFSQGSFISGYLSESITNSIADSVEYKIIMFNTADTFYVNRSDDSTDGSDNFAKSICNLQIMEIS